METDLVISLRCKSKEHRDFLRLMLSDDSDRPLFSEDVSPSLREWFNALEELDSADWVTAEDGLVVHAGWLLSGDYEETLMEIDSSLRKAGVQELRAVVAGDEGWYQLWLQHNGKLRAYDHWQGQELDVLFDGEEDLAALIDTLEP